MLIDDEAGEGGPVGARERAEREHQVVARARARGSAGRSGCGSPIVLVSVPMPSHLEPHLVARLQRRRLLGLVATPELEQASAAARAAGDDVTRRDPGSAGREVHELLEAPRHRREGVAAQLDAVDERGRAEVEPVALAIRLELVRGDDPWPERVGKVLGLVKAERQAGLQAGDVALGPVVEDRVAGDVVAGLLDADVAPGATDDRGHLELEVQAAVNRGRLDGVAGTGGRVRV